MQIQAIDLFCGAGGLTRGMLDAGVTVRAGFDVDGACKHAYEHNNRGAKFFECDVARLTAKRLKTLWGPRSIRLLAGCAPCQPFSAAANASRLEDDPRYELLTHFLRLVRGTRPHLVTMENVPAVRAHKPFEKFVEQLREWDYDVWYKSVACTEYGVPQTRRRLVLLASRIGKIGKGLMKPNMDGVPKTVADVIGHLPRLKAGEVDPDDPIHIARALTGINLKRMKASKPGGSWKDWPESLRSPCHTRAEGESYASVYARMKADEPSPTITTQFFNFGTGRFGHPSQHRTITPREAALLQSFPPGYEFVPQGADVFQSTLGRMIGNAVPPKLGEAIGRTFLEHVAQHRGGSAQKAAK